MRREQETDAADADGPTAITAMTNVNMSAPATPRRMPASPPAGEQPASSPCICPEMGFRDKLREGRREAGRTEEGPLAPAFLYFSKAHSSHHLYRSFFICDLQPNEASSSSGPFDIRSVWWCRK